MSDDGNYMDERNAQAGDRPDQLIKSAELLMKAAELGDADAQFQLGWLYTRGQGVLQDYEKAAYAFVAANFFAV